MAGQNRSEQKKPGPLNAEDRARLAVEIATVIRDAEMPEMAAEEIIDRVSAAVEDAGRTRHRAAQAAGIAWARANGVQMGRP